MKNMIEYVIGEKHSFINKKFSSRIVWYYPNGVFEI